MNCPTRHIPGGKALLLPRLSHGRSVSAGGGTIGYPRRRLRIATRDFRRGGRQPRQPLPPGLPLQPLVVPRHGQVQQDATYPVVIAVVVCLVDNVGRTTIPPPSSATTRGDDRALVSSVFSVLESDTVMVPPSIPPPHSSSSTPSVVRSRELERRNERHLIKTKASNAAAMTAIDSPTETPSAGRGAAGPDGASTTNAR